MAKKLYNMVVKSGVYTNASGESKNRYVNIGVVMATDDGGAFALLEPHINLAGFNRGDNDNVMVSLFKPDNETNNKSKPSNDIDKMEDDIPF